MFIIPPNHPFNFESRFVLSQDPRAKPTQLMSYPSSGNELGKTPATSRSNRGRARTALGQSPPEMWGRALNVGRKSPHNTCTNATGALDAKLAEIWEGEGKRSEAQDGQFLYPFQIKLQYQCRCYVAASVEFQTKEAIAVANK